MRTWLPIAVFAVLWLDLIRLLSTQWEAREQYAYGWFVPIFALALLWRRWLDRPGAGLQDNRTTGPQDQRSVAPSPSVSSLVVSSPVVSSPVVRGPVVRGPIPFLLSAFCFLLLPLRVIYEINTDWPLISWVYTLIVVALTLYAFHLADPSRNPSNFSFQLSTFRFSPWLRHFAFPICFILVAVVWPYRIEKGLTQGLMRIVASVTVELLGWLNIPALQKGNLIELSTGTLGIEEACSGIRSFQSSLMAALVLGELYRFRLWPRAALVVLGLGIGFCFNIVRTTLLSWQTNAHGLNALEKWHDPAGITITITCFFCLWGIAVLLRKRSEKAESRTQKGLRDDGVMSGGVADNRASGAPISAFCFPLSAFSRAFCFRSCRTYLLALGLWSLLCIGVTEAWYRSHTPKDSGVFHWSVALPEGQAGFEKIQLAPRTIQLLRYDQAATGTWRVDDGSEWSVNFFRWQPRSIESVIDSRVHRPEVCLPASGFRQVSDSGLIRVEAKGLELPFREYTYEMDGRNAYVFFCQWEDGAEHQAGMESSGQADRIQSVLKGRRLVGQQTLEIIVTDCPSLEQAEQQVRKDLPGLIRLDSPLRTAQANP